MHPRASLVTSNTFDTTNRMHRATTCMYGERSRHEKTTNSCVCWDSERAVPVAFTVRNTQYVFTMLNLYESILYSMLVYMLVLG